MINDMFFSENEKLLRLIVKSAHLQTLKKLEADQFYLLEDVFYELEKQILHNDCVFAAILILKDERVKTYLKERFLYLLEWEELRNLRKKVLHF